MIRHGLNSVRETPGLGKRLAGVIVLMAYRTHHD
jgi:hypothetical protein